jgi:hypothetical protein
MKPQLSFSIKEHTKTEDFFNVHNGVKYSSKYDGELKKHGVWGCSVFPAYPTRVYLSFIKIKHLYRYLKSLNNDVFDVSVSRSRRGEWGEWFENYEWTKNKFTKIKEGWM